MAFPHSGSRHGMTIPLSHGHSHGFAFEVESVLVAVSDHVVGLKRNVRLEAFAGMADQMSHLHLCDRFELEGAGAGFDLMYSASCGKQLDEVFVAAYEMYA